MIRFDNIFDEVCIILENYLNNKILFVMNDFIGKIIFDECLYYLWKGNKELLNSVLKIVKFLLLCRKSVYYDNRM